MKPKLGKIALLAVSTSVGFLHRGSAVETSVMDSTRGQGGDAFDNDGSFKSGGSHNILGTSIKQLKDGTTIESDFMLVGRPASAAIAHRVLGFPNEQAVSSPSSNLFDSKPAEVNDSSYIIEQMDADLALLYDALNSNQTSSLMVSQITSPDMSVAAVNINFDPMAYVVNHNSKPMTYPKAGVGVKIQVCNKVLKGKNCTSPKNTDPSYYRVTSVEDLWKDLSIYLDTLIDDSQNFTNRHRHLASFPNLYLTGFQMQKLSKASEMIYNGAPLEQSLDFLAGSVVGLLCTIPFWAASANTFGSSVPVGQIICGWVGLFAGYIFSKFNWFGDPSLDDAYWTVNTANVDDADGNSLNIAYHRGRDRDNDSLGYIRRGVSVTTREDLDARTVERIEVFIEDTDDVCVTEMKFRLNQQPSGTGSVQEIGINAAAFSIITDTPFQNGYCIYFGNEEGAIANFEFHWPSALTCHRNFALHFNGDYFKCLSWAMVKYDKRVNGRFLRYTYTSTPQLPAQFSDPYLPIRHQQNNRLCFDVANYSMENGNPINLIECTNNDAQRFDIDSQGRIRSFVNPTKCVEAGSAGTLYRKLYIYDCHYGAWQQWTFLSDGRIRNNYHAKYIGLAYCSIQSKTPLELRWYEDGHCGDAQKWMSQY